MLLVAGYARQHSKINSLYNESFASLMTGLGISSIVFLIFTAQVWIYFRRHTIQSRENWQSKLLVAIIWLMQAAQMALTSRIVSVHTADFEDFPQFIGRMSTEWAIYTGICTLTTSLVHCVFICRVCSLEKSLCGRRRMTFVLIAFCAMEQVFGCLKTIFILFKLNNHTYYTMALWAPPISIGCSAIGDILIAGTLVYILHSNKTELPRTNRMITKLIIFCSQTGLITTVAAFITLGIWAVCSFVIKHLYTCFPMGCLYATCLLANFIARDSYLQPQTVHESDISTISSARFTKNVHVDLNLKSSSDTKSGHQETLEMEEGKSSDLCISKTFPQ
ncbi:uncharacterized protein EDB93DRAFT_355928 [Suillus bovinus]|uniref:uncharacterized protein n=1 Tax=Suillus bovinus TaxID=48563 RepID=UPI001B876DCC|nr:uncharacterized protein EDB93DRAFT_355928 [Suillus bovinus]KAG2149043.1 hypothetical protein EDB93DRAFT_355928 [Suillus bovinus]